MVQSCAFDSDCDELNFCENRVCVEVGLNDPCRMPVLSGIDPSIAARVFNQPRQFSRDSMLLGDIPRPNPLRSLLTGSELQLLAKQIFKSPLCPAELICSKALRRCVKPSSEFTVIPPIVNPYFSLNGTSSGLALAPLSAYSMLADDRPGSQVGVVCRRDNQCRVNHICEGGRCERLPGLNEQCKGKKCHAPFVCSKRGVCRFPCFGDLDCAQADAIGASSNDLFVCTKGRYCDVEDLGISLYIWILLGVIVGLAIIIPIIVFLVIKLKTKKIKKILDQRGIQSSTGVYESGGGYYQDSQGHRSGHGSHLATGSDEHRHGEHSHHSPHRHQDDPQHQHHAHEAKRARCSHEREDRQYSSSRSRHKTDDPHLIYRPGSPCKSDFSSSSSSSSSFSSHVSARDAEKAQRSRSQPRHAPAISPRQKHHHPPSKKRSGTRNHTYRHKCHSQTSLSVGPVGP